MDLKSGEPLWPALTRDVGDPVSPSGDVDADAVVLGAGVSGAMCAFLLAEAGVDVVVLDRRGWARGSTPASTALVQYDVDTPLIELEKMIGATPARSAYRATHAALESIVELIQRTSIDCNLVRASSLYLADQDSDVAWLRKERAARSAIGVDATFLERADLQSRYAIDRPGGVLSSAALALDPYRVTLGLLRAAVHRGARILSPVEAAPTRVERDRVILETKSGSTITGRNLIVATGYETPQFFEGIGELCTLKSTYALASAAISGDLPWENNLLFWDTADPYFYARQTVDHRVIIGGEDTDVVEAEARDRLIPSKVKKLLAKFATFFPHAKLEPEFVWAGTFAETDDGLPFIGAHADWPGCHFALGYGGNGITFSMIAAEVIRDAIVQRSNAVDNGFRFDRKTKSGKNKMDPKGPR